MRPTDSDRDSDRWPSTKASNLPAVIPTRQVHPRGDVEIKVSVLFLSLKGCTRTELYEEDFVSPNLPGWIELSEEGQQRWPEFWKGVECQVLDPFRRSHFASETARELFAAWVGTQAIVDLWISQEIPGHRF